MFVQPAIFYLEIEAVVGEGGRERQNIYSQLPPLSLRPSLTPLVQIYFSPQHSTAIEIKDGHHNFHEENSEY